MSAEKIKKLNDILTTQYGHLNIEAFNQIQDLYAKQSKQEEVKPLTLDEGLKILESAGYVISKKPQPQIKEQPKGRVESTTGSKLGSSHWYRTHLATIKHIGEYLMKGTQKEEILKAWGKQLYDRSIEMLSVEPTLQDNGLREAAEKVVKNWRKNVLSTQIEKGIDELEKALK